MHEDHLLKGSSVSPLQSLIAGSISGAVARYVLLLQKVITDNRQISSWNNIKIACTINHEDRWSFTIVPQLRWLLTI